MEVPTGWLYDLEAYDDEATSAVSLKELLALCHVVSISIHEALHGPEFSPPSRQTSFEQVSAALGSIVRGGESVDHLSDRLGWEVSTYLTNSEEFYKLTIDGLQDICDPLDIYWPEVVHYAALRQH